MYHDATERSAQPSNACPEENPRTEEDTHDGGGCFSRRDFLQRFVLVGAAGAGASTVLAACGEGGGGEGEGGVTCDMSGLTEQERTQREAFNYVAQTSNPQQRCNNCQFWQPDQVDGACGGCQLFPGPVNPQGWCNSWVQGSGNSA